MLTLKKIKDERLKLKNLKNVRVTYIIQTLGILGILGYDLVTKGLDGIIGNPLWIVLMITITVFFYLSMDISIDHETGKKSPRKGLNIAVVLLVIISVVIGFFVAISDGYNVFDGVIMGGILFVCGLVPAIYIYYLRHKKAEDNDI